MTPAGLLCIILGFVLMVVIIMNNLISQGILMTRDQKINIFLEEFSMMDKEEKARFVNEYYTNIHIKSMCKLFN
jgi:small nuclear ribonucleoprotein (snRNP)-like protein